MLNIPTIHSNSCLNLNEHTTYRWMATAIGATILVTSLLVAAYGSWILQRAPSHLPFFQGMEQLNSGQIALIVTGSAITALFSSGLLVYIHNRNDKENHIDKNLRPLSLSWAALQEYRLPDLHFNFVKSFLEELPGEKISPQKYHSFYYHLTCISEHILKNYPHNKKPWSDFLNGIHNQKGCLENNKVIAIDSAWELRRLEGSFPTFSVEELESPEAKRGALPHLAGIIQEAFQLDPPTLWTILFTRKQNGLKALVFAQHNRTFVIRNQENSKILAMIMLEKEPHENEKPSLYIHTLARKASAVKIGLTEKFQDALKEILNPEEYGTVYCKVLRNNTHAKRIYERIGFVEESSNDQHFKMIYAPTI